MTEPLLPALAPKKSGRALSATTGRHLRKGLAVLVATLLCFVAGQAAIAELVPMEDVYPDRLDYDTVKDDTRNLIAPIREVKAFIDSNKLDDYVVMVGDSVGFGSPVAPKDSMSAQFRLFRQRSGEGPAVFNFAMPAMQLGDVYTVLLMLRDYGISTDRVLLNIRYASFVERNPDPPAVFWLKEELKAYDPEAFERVRPQLESNGYKAPEASMAKRFASMLVPPLSAVEYRDYLKQSLKLHWKGDSLATHAIGDIRTWTEKQGLKEYLMQPEYTRIMTDQPLKLDESSIDVYFLDRILGLIDKRKSLFYMGGVNPVLMREFVEKPGYKANLAAIEQMFRDRGVRLINYQGQLPHELYTDHEHFTPEGYRVLGERLWQELAGKGTD